MHLPGCLEPRQRAGGLHAVAGLEVAKDLKNLAGTFPHEFRQLHGWNFSHLGLLLPSQPFLWHSQHLSQSQGWRHRHQRRARPPRCHVRRPAQRSQRRPALRVAPLRHESQEATLGTGAARLLAFLGCLGHFWTAGSFHSLLWSQHGQHTPPRLGQRGALLLSFLWHRFFWRLFRWRQFFWRLRCLSLFKTSALVIRIALARLLLPRCAVRFLFKR
mmetsp:Transcript_25347/g.41152  ORF Transcript_25347/g.41152 Transcript_25347/m.41152 type:complete len:216 (-) Transcript_25347:481-1128(-)